MILQAIFHQTRSLDIEQKSSESCSVLPAKTFILSSSISATETEAEKSEISNCQKKKNKKQKKPISWPSERLPLIW